MVLLNEREIIRKSVSKTIILLQKANAGWANGIVAKLKALVRISEITGYTSFAPPGRTEAVWMNFRKAIFNFYCEYVAKEFVPFV